jgi:polyisoprenoid-binding protein YceI
MAALAAVCVAVSVPLAGPARAQRVALTPANSQVGYIVFAFGLFPIRGAFQRFNGVAVVDGTNPLACHVDVTIDVASLHMAEPYRQRQALEPDMLAAARYPFMHFSGRCVLPALVGALNMHGVSRPVSLVMRRSHGGIIATGTLYRQDFGILGLPHMVGSQVRIRLATPAPAALLQALP